jgi:hypothetical protein
VIRHLGLSVSLPESNHSDRVHTFQSFGRLRNLPYADGGTVRRSQFGRIDWRKYLQVGARASGAHMVLVLEIEAQNAGRRPALQPPDISCEVWDKGVLNPPNFRLRPKRTFAKLVSSAMTERDELTPALTRTWNKRLAEETFRRVGRRDLQRVSNGILHLFNFQVSAWGSRDFCVNVAAFTLCGNDLPVLQPGFRLRRPSGGEMWLPSRSPDEAAESVETAWKAAEIQAMPWFETNATLEGHLTTLRAEPWNSQHHGRFQIGVVEAMLCIRNEAISDLVAASRLYAEDGRSWCASYIEKSEALIDALNRGEEAPLLDQWRKQNLLTHRIKSP